MALIPEEGREKAMGWWEGYLKRKGWDKWLGVEGDGEGNIGGHGRLVVE